MELKKRTVKPSGKAGKISPERIKAAVRAAHVVSASSTGEWEVRAGAKTREGSRYATKAEAMNAAREIARQRGGDVVVHGKDGRVRWVTSDKEGASASKK